MTEHKVPLKVVGKEGVVVVGDKAVGPAVVEGVSAGPWKIEDGTTLDVVMIEGSDPAATRDTIRSLRRVPAWARPRLVTVCSLVGSKLIQSIGVDSWGLYPRGIVMVTTDGFPGPLPTACAGAREGDGRWVLFVEAGVVLSVGAVLSMILTGEAEGASMVCPWTTKSFNPLSGTSYAETADRLAERPPVPAGEIALPVESCFMVRRSDLEAVGGFEESADYYGFGGGHVADLALRMLRSGLSVVRAPGAYVLDRTPGRVDSGDWSEVPAGFKRLGARWGAPLLDMVRGMAKAEAGDLERTSAFLQSVGDTGRPRVCFVFHEATLCGAVLAVTHICNGLIELGWDATFACVRLESVHRSRIPMNFEPLVYPNERQMVYSLGVDMPVGTHLLATIWASARYVSEACERNPGHFVPGYFVQDDERRFRKPSGTPYVEAWKVEEAWSLFDRVIVNSDWVLEQVKEFRGPGSSDLVKIGIGVDSVMFRSRVRSGASGIRIMAHSRPSTPRRGWPFICAVLNAVGNVCDVEIVTYDEEPEGLAVPVSSHLGRVSPADLAREMGPVDIFVEGSERQGWGMQALEAMACGCALVCTANYGIDNFGTSGHDCVIVPHGDVDRAAGVLRHLVEREDERSALGRNAMETARRFDWALIAEGWAKCLSGS